MIDLAAWLTDQRNTQIIGVSNQKGGVGKTSTTVNLADAMRRLFDVLYRKVPPKGRAPRILVLDLDPQGSATEWLASPTADGETWVQQIPALDDSVEPWAPPATFAHTLADVVMQTTPEGVLAMFSTAIVPVQGLDGLYLLPIDLRAQVVERDLLRQFHAVTDGRRASHHIEECLGRLVGAFDVIICDGAPGLSEFSDAMYRLADQIIIPTGSNTLALGANLRTRVTMLQVCHAEAVRLGQAPHYPIIHVIKNLFPTQRTNMGTTMEAVLEEVFGRTCVAYTMKSRIDMQMLPMPDAVIGRGHTVFERSEKLHDEAAFFKDLANRCLNTAVKAAAEVA